MSAYPFYENIEYILEDLKENNSQLVIEYIRRNNEYILTATIRDDYGEIVGGGGNNMSMLMDDLESQALEWVEDNE